MGKEKKGAACEKRRKEPPSWKEYTERSKKTFKDVVKKVRKGMSKKINKG